MYQTEKVLFLLVYACTASSAIMYKHVGKRGLLDQASMQSLYAATYWNTYLLSAVRSPVEPLIQPAVERDEILQITPEEEEEVWPLDGWSSGEAVGEKRIDPRNGKQIKAPR